MQTSLDVLSILPRNILLLLIVLVFILLFSVLIAGVWIIKNKDIKLKNIEVVAQSQKELYRTEVKNTLDNQTSNAHNLLKKVWIDLYETGRKKFNITDTTANASSKFLSQPVAVIVI